MTSEGLNSRRLLAAYREPLTYNFAVARAFLRQVYIAEGLAPPTSTEAFTSVYRTLFERAKNPAYWREIGQSGEWAKVALYGIEAYGIFHIGQMSKWWAFPLYGDCMLTASSRAETYCGLQVKLMVYLYSCHLGHTMIVVSIL